MNPAVCIPWFYSDSLDRFRAFEAVCRFWEPSEWPLFVSSYATERATARNEVAHAALDLGHDVIVFNDADTICRGDQVEAAVRLAAEAPGLVYCYDLYVRLDRNASEELAANPAGSWPLSFERQYFNAPSIGCVALSADTYLATGGLDEGYRGWGYEDLDFVDRCQRVAPIRRVPGPAFHLWHGERYGDEPEALSYGATMVSAPRDADPSLAEANRRRWRLAREESPV